MKKAKRIVALTLALLLCLPLCSCKELDDMRTHQAFLQEDGTILWNEAVYVPLSEEDLRMCEEYGLFDDYGSRTYAYLTDTDTPVLLSERFGNRMYVYDDNTILCGYSGDGTISFCREDCYERVKAKIDEIVKRNEVVGYSITFRSPYTGQENVIPLTEEQQSVLQTVMSTVVPDYWVKPEIRFDAVTLVGHNYLGEPLSDVAMLERTGDGRYNLILYTEEPMRQYAVPEEYYPLCDEMMIPFWKSQGMTEDMFPKR